MSDEFEVYSEAIELDTAVSAGCRCGSGSECSVAGVVVVDVDLVQNVAVAEPKTPCR